MAKKPKTKQAKKAGKLPKEIGGVEIPKKLRKEGEKLIALLKHPLVAEMAAAGLMAFAREMRAGSGDADAQRAENAAAEAKAARKTASRRLDDVAQVAAILGTVLAARGARK